MSTIKLMLPHLNLAKENPVGKTEAKEKEYNVL